MSILAHSFFLITGIPEITYILLIYLFIYLITKYASLIRLCFSIDLISLLLQLVYSGYSCTQGWFFTPCTSDPSLRFDVSKLKQYLFTLMLLSPCHSVLYRPVYYVDLVGCFELSSWLSCAFYDLLNDTIELSWSNRV